MGLARPLRGVRVVSPARAHPSALLGKVPRRLLAAHTFCVIRSHLREGRL